MSRKKVRVPRMKMRWLLAFPISVSFALDHQKLVSPQKRPDLYRRIYNASRKLVCEFNGFETTSRVVQERATNLTKEEVTSVYVMNGNRDDQGRYYNSTKIEFRDPPVVSVEIVWVFKKNKKTIDFSYSLINRIRYQGRGIQEVEKHEFPILLMLFDSKCPPKQFQTWEYNQKNLPHAVSLFDKDGKLFDTVYANREVMRLSEIYKSYDAKRLETIIKTIKRRDRVIVTDLGTGVDYNHPDIAYKLLRKNGKLVGRDFKDQDDEPYDFIPNAIMEPFNHDTHMVGTITSNTKDIVVLPIRYNSDQPETLYDAIRFAHDMGSRIVNMSFGTEVAKEFEPIDRAAHDFPDMLFIAAAGNNSANADLHPIYPAGLQRDNIIAIASTNDNGKLSPISNWGKNTIKLAAPGENILSTFPENQYARAWGTSTATAFITRAAGLLKFVYPDWGPREIVEKLCSSVTQTNELLNKTECGGFINSQNPIFSEIEIIKGTHDWTQINSFTR